MCCRGGGREREGRLFHYFLEETNHFGRSPAGVVEGEEVAAALPYFGALVAGDNGEEVGVDVDAGEGDEVDGVVPVGLHYR